jgi:hypothetical protein
MIGFILKPLMVLLNFFSCLDLILNNEKINDPKLLSTVIFMISISIIFYYCFKYVSNKLILF